MLNLQELERKLDEALAHETPESLTSWLLNLRASAPTNLTTKPVDLGSVDEQFTPDRFGQAKFSAQLADMPNQYDYAMAA